MAYPGGPLERDTIAELILPAIGAAGWTDDQVRREYRLKAERVVSLGGVSRQVGDGVADIVLEAAPGTPVAVIEAKRAYRTAADAMQQAVRYAQQLDVPLAYGANGSEILERNLVTGVERRVSAIAAPAFAWSEYVAMHGLDAATGELIAQPFNRRVTLANGDVQMPRYYQTVAINRVLTAIAQGKKRVLLLMATGTGKTFTAMQIVAKLRAWEKHLHPDRNYRVLYLADRDQLLKQPQGKDFTKAFGADPLWRILGEANTAREIYFASYQALTGGNPDAGEALGEDALLFSAYRPDFFDLVIVDEAHRGSATEESSWRKVLDHFSSAVQLGMTATPLQGKRLDPPDPGCLPDMEGPRTQYEQISYEYFGNPVFTYSLRDGIEDGYLAPYRVRRVVLSPDAEGWEPTEGQKDRFGRDIPEGTYSTRDFERVVSLLARTRLAAHHLSGVLRQDPTGRAIVFCVDVEHANDMREALIAENPDLVAADPEWVVRIVGIEGEKTRLLDDFTDPDKTSPVVATTSRLLSTGVDVQDLKYVVLFRPVGSMIEFKQIIGRGARLYPDKGKYWFEVIDYVGASALFNDPGFDGYPAAIRVDTVGPDGTVTTTTTEPTGEPLEPGPDSPDPVVNEPEPPFTPTGPDDPAQPPPPPPPRRKYYVDDDPGFRVGPEAQLRPTVEGGQLVLTEYGDWVRDRIRELGSDADTLRRNWASADSRHKLVAMLQDHGLDLAEIADATEVPGIDPLDARVHLAWSMPTRTRAERARRVRETHATELGAMTARARGILEGLLQRYETYGVDDIDDPTVFRLAPLSQVGSPTELAEAVGGPEELHDRLNLVQQWLYADAA